MNQKIRFSIRLNNDLPITQYLELAKLAEKYSFDQFWVSNDLFLKSALVILAAIAKETQKIHLGTCIVNPYTLNPAEIAMAASTLDELSGGRFNLGISAGAKEFLEWVGLAQEAPLRAVRESIAVINRLLDGNRVEYHGKFLSWSDEAYMRVNTKRVPIYIGAMSPKMLQLIGEVADGGLPLLFPPKHYATVIKHIEAGTKKAGRDLNSLDILACVWCSLSSDRERAKDELRTKIAYYGPYLSPLILEALNLTQKDFIEIEKAMMKENDLEKAKSLVTGKMLNIGIVGDSKDLIHRLENLVQLGVNHISFGPPLGPDPLEAINILGKTVLPHFK